MPFRFKCNRIIFSPEEINLLNHYGSSFERLMNGAKIPETPQQEHFLDVCRGVASPKNEYEKLWHKYLLRIKWEADPKNQVAMKPSQVFINNSFGGSREAYKEMKRQNFSDMVKRSRRK